MLDFDRIARDLSEKQVSELSRSFFVGWQLSRQASVKFGARYLQEVEERLTLIPSKLRARNYCDTEFDWLTECRESRIYSRYLGQSARYVPSENHSAALRLRLKDRGWS